MQPHHPSQPGGSGSPFVWPPSMQQSPTTHINPNGQAATNNHLANTLGNGTQIPSSSSSPSAYANPASLLGVYSFAPYTPTARVAGHFAPIPSRTRPRRHRRLFTPSTRRHFSASTARRRHRTILHATTQSSRLLLSSCRTGATATCELDEGTGLSSHPRPYTTPQRLSSQQYQPYRQQTQAYQQSAQQAQPTQQQQPVQYTQYSPVAQQQQQQERYTQPAYQSPQVQGSVQQQYWSQAQAQVQPQRTSVQTPPQGIPPSVQSYQQQQFQQQQQQELRQRQQLQQYQQQQQKQQQQQQQKQQQQYQQQQQQYQQQQQKRQQYQQYQQQYAQATFPQPTGQQQPSPLQQPANAAFPQLPQLQVPSQQSFSPQLQHQQTQSPQLQYQLTQSPQLQYQQTQSPQLQYHQKQSPQLQYQQTQSPQEPHLQTVSPQLQYRQTPPQQQLQPKVSPQLQFQQQPTVSPQLQFQQTLSPQQQYQQQQSPQQQYQQTFSPQQAQVPGPATISPQPQQLQTQAYSQHSFPQQQPPSLAQTLPSAQQQQLPPVQPTPSPVQQPPAMPPQPLPPYLPQHLQQAPTQQSKPRVPRQPTPSTPFAAPAPDANGQPAPTLPMPYAFLTPQSAAGSQQAWSFTPPPGNTQPPTPNSLASVSPARSAVSDRDYLEAMVNRSLQLRTPKRSTPEQEVPGVGAMPPTLPRPVAIAPTSSASAASSARPTPAKKRKSNTSPTTPQKQKGNVTPTTPRSIKGSLVIEPPRLSPAEKSAYVYKSTSTLSGAERSTMSLHSTPPPAAEDDEDDLDWGDDVRDADGDWKMSQGNSSLGEATVAVASGRTGDKDQRSSFQKLQSLIEDIFEEADAFPANPTSDEVAASRYFDTLSADGDYPLLSIRTMEKVVRYFTRLNVNKKRQRRKAKGEAIPWHVDSLARLLRMLERVMREADSLTPFPDDGCKAVVGHQVSPKKKGKKKAADAAKAPSPDIGINDEDLERSEIILDKMMRSASAALCSLVVLNGDNLPKQLFSEDLLSLAVSSIREEMEKIIFPIVEALAGEKIQSSYLYHLASAESNAAASAKASRKPSTQFTHETLASISQSTCAAVPHISALVNRHDLSFSDSLVIQTVYLSLGPVFVHEPAVPRGRGKDSGGPSWSVMRSLKMEALGCLRGVFAKYEDQRTWIIEEILGSLGKHEQGSAQTRFQLANGSSISTLSALLLQLVQASCHGVGDRIRRLRTAHLDFENGEPSEPQSTTQEEAEIMKHAMDTASQATTSVTRFLVQKSGATKGSRSHDTDFKAVLDTFVADLLKVIYLPEWPVATLFLTVLSMTLMMALKDTKTNSETNALRSVALDYLGDIAARLRYLQLDMKSQHVIPTLDEVIANADVDGMSELLAAEGTIQNYLVAAARDDGMFISSAEMTRIMWGRELHPAYGKAASVVERLGAEAEEVETKEKLQMIVQAIRKAMREVWNPDVSLFEISGPTQAEEAAKLSLAVSRSGPLQSAFEGILHALVAAMDTTVVGLRSRALRGLSTIVVTDPEVLSLPVVRTAIEDRLSDTSPAVREAAVDLIGKYVVQRADLAVEYYPLLAMRVTDTGLGVRKRVVKLLRDIFGVTKDRDVSVKICCRLVIASGDEDDGVKDLALKTLSEMLYPPSTFNANETAGLIVDILKEYDGMKEKHGPPKTLQTALENVSQQCSQNGQGQSFAQTIDAVINRMVDATEDDDFDALSHIRAIYLLGFDVPALVDTNKATILKTYLSPKPRNREQRQVNDLLLQVFTRSIPHMPKASSNFAVDLSKTLGGLIGNPTGIGSLEWPVKCYGAVVNNLTREYTKAIGLLRSCLNKALHGDPTTSLTTMVYYITALVAEHFDFEKVAEDDATIAGALLRIRDSTPLPEYLFGLYLTFSSKVSNQQIPILCLAALFRANPQLVLDERTGEWMKQVFTIATPDDRAHLLELLYKFLLSEAERQGVKGSSTKGVSDLIGRTNELRESGVSTAVVQRNIDYIVEGAKSHHPPLQEAAMNVLTFTVNQGLYHPLHLLPILISLETSDDEHMAQNAFDLHAMLHTKHPSLLNVRHLEFTRSSYDYLRSVTSEVSGQRFGVAKLAAWYRLLSEKRAWRLDFLRAITKAFSFELLSQEEINPQFVLYVAENLATFGYQLQEEVMVVIQQLSQVVSEGTAVGNAIELARVEGAGTDLIDDKVAIVSESEQFPAKRLADASLVVAVAVLTKNLLLEVYGLTEDKCLKFTKKSTIGDKPVSRRYDQPMPLDSSRIPLVRGIETVDDFASQQATFLQLMREDGSLGGWTM